MYMVVMLSLLHAKGRVSYSIYATFRRAIQLSTHDANQTFNKFGDNFKYLSLSNDERRSVYHKDTVKEAGRKKGRILKLHKRTAEEVDNVSDTFTDIENLDDHDKFGNLCNEDIFQLRAGPLKREENERNRTHSSKNKIFSVQRGRERSDISGKDGTKYNSREDSLTDGGPLQGTTYSKFMAKNKEFPDVDIDEKHRPLKEHGKFESRWYTLKIREYGKKGMIQEAIAVIDKWMLTNERVKPTVEHFNELIHVLARVGYTKKAFNMLTLIHKMGMKPNKYTYASLFNACSNSPHPETDGLRRANKLWQHIQETDPILSVPVYQAMMKAFAKGNDMKAVMVIADFIMERYPRSAKVDEVLSFLLKAVEENKETGFLHALAVWRMIKRSRKNFKPDLYNYNQLLNITRLCGIGNEEDLEKMLLETEYTGPSVEFSQLPRADGPHEGSVFAEKHEKIDNGNSLESRFLAPSQSTHQGSTGKVKSISTDNIPQKGDPRIKSTEDDYRTSRKKVIKGTLSKNEVIEDMEWWEIAQMEEKGETKSISRSPLDLNCLSPPSDVKIEHNFPDLLNPMETLSDVISISKITTAEDRMNLLGGVKGFLIRMDMDGVAPDIRTMGLIVNMIPHTESAEVALLRFMEDKGIVPDIEMLNHLMWRRCKSKRHDEAKRALDLIHHYDKVPNMQTYTILTKSVCNEKEAFEHLHNIQLAGMHPHNIVFMELISPSWAYYNYPYKKRLLMEMKALNVRPDRLFLSCIERVNSEIEMKFTSTNEKQKWAGGSCDKQRQFYDFKAFYRKWLQSVELQEEDGAWDSFKLTGKTKIEKTKKKILP